ncbi:Kinase associated domain 1 (KA1) [Dillenia turbinata]|uniref:non-specific serine/threonine protein kinase n=1 Tax=Dillenia turbinata TaxID=194707 RepID=A0AAN8V4P6_9MAGN
MFREMDKSTSRGSSSRSAAILHNYRIIKNIGHGNYAKVVSAEHLPTGNMVAIKILDRHKMKQDKMEENVKREIKIFRLLVHPHILRLYEIMETPTKIYLVMEYMDSGDLYDYIIQNGRLHDNVARKMFQQIISGLEYCHKNMVAHRDLKPENLLLDSKGNVKIADFGLSNILQDGHFLKTSCGSPNYAAPEVVSRRLYAGPEVDVWSCGVILYAMLCAFLPFDDGNLTNLYKKIKSAFYLLPSNLSPGARDLIQRMLEVDPMKRITIPEIRQHYWFLACLPPYLALPQPDTRRQTNKAHAAIPDKSFRLYSIVTFLRNENAINTSQVDENILEQVVQMGFDKGQLIESLQNRKQNNVLPFATVTYHLLLDNLSRASGHYLRPEILDSMEGGFACTYWADLQPFPVDCFRGQSNHQSIGLRPSLTQQQRKWDLGLQSAAHPQEIMIVVLKAMENLDVLWKKIGHYNMKCKWFRGSIEHPESMMSTPIEDPSTSTSMMSDTDALSQNEVKFELQPWLQPWHLSIPIFVLSPSSHAKYTVTLPCLHYCALKLMLIYAFVFVGQLYMTPEDKYLLDLQRVAGSQILFLDFCAALLGQLKVF